ncbi:MAG: hypothetical protein DMF59_13415 [Acidobacteria bacterium]|nr:MAG: hypothetical protein DMF59_13415 [Acidobacteriota bacterium]
MNMRYTIALFILLAPLSTNADALSDLRPSLAQLAATTPVHGAFEITSTSSNSDEEKPFQGKATVGFEISDAGLRVIYPKSTLTQANQEARAEASDPDRQTPTRSGMSRIRALQLAELLDAAAMLNNELLTAQLIETKPTTYQGHMARLILMKLSPKLSKGSSKHVKKIDATLSIWVGDDGIPIGAERSVSVKASMLLMSFESDQKDSWTFTRTGDRLVAIHHAETQKSDGFGQHNLTHVEQAVRLEP